MYVLKMCLAACTVYLEIITLLSCLTVSTNVFLFLFECLRTPPYTHFTFDALKSL